MEKDPYEKFINMCRQEGSTYNPPNIRLGTVMNESPLVIKVGELQLIKEDLLINYSLLDYKEDFSLNKTSASGSTSQGSISSIEIPKGQMNIKGVLKKEDIVVLQPISESQTWIILCKVVRP